MHIDISCLPLTAGAVCVGLTADVIPAAGVCPFSFPSSGGTDTGAGGGSRAVSDAAGGCGQAAEGGWRDNSAPEVQQQVQVRRTGIKGWAWVYC